MVTRRERPSAIVARRWVANKRLHNSTFGLPVLRAPAPAGARLYADGLANGGDCPQLEHQARIRGQTHDFYRRAGGAMMTKCPT